jgi:hypothetical protein
MTHSDIMTPMNVSKSVLFLSMGIQSIMYVWMYAQIHTMRISLIIDVINAQMNVRHVTIQSYV